MNNTWDKALPFFTEEELACKGTGIIQLDIRFAVALPALRLQWGRPLHPTSVCRTPKHNQDEGGHPTSLHLTVNPKHRTTGTMAADVHWEFWTGNERIEFGRMAYVAGWSVGLSDVFVHIDRRGDVGLPQHVFDYGDQWSNHFDKSAIQGLAS